jgi:hypothetical protein
MEIMGLSSQNKIFDSFRKIWVPETPEELVRQSLLKKMIQELGYPKELLVIEKELGQLSHLKQVKVPKRRLDILCYGKGIHPKHGLYPLLLIECKKDSLTQDAKEQLLGYNSFVQACFVAAASKEEILFGSRDLSTFYHFLPPYSQLIQALK